MAQGDPADGQVFEKVGERVSIFLRDGRWYVNYQQGRRQVRKSLKTGSKKEARRKALAIERDLLGGKLFADKRPPLIVDIAAAFVDAKKSDGLAASTLEKYAYCIGHLHTFRHTFISLGLTRGVPEATVREWVGHVDDEMIRRYTHIASQESHGAMQRLEASVLERRAAAKKPS